MDRAAQLQVGNVVTAALRHRHDVVDLHQVGRATGHAGERVLVAANPTVPLPHGAPYGSRDVPPRAAGTGRFGCWRSRCRPVLGQLRSHSTVRLGVGRRTNVCCPRRLLVSRRTGCVAPILLPARGRYRLRSLARRRTAGKCDAGGGSSRSGCGEAGNNRAGGGVRSPFPTPVRYQRRPLVARRTSGVVPILLAARGRYPLRSLVLRRTSGVAPILLAARRR